MTRHGGAAKAMVQKDGQLVEVAAEAAKTASPPLTAAPSSAASAGQSTPGVAAKPNTATSGTNVSAATAAAAAAPFPGLFGAPFGAGAAAPALAAAPLAQGRTAMAASSNGSSSSSVGAGEGDGSATTADDDAEKRQFVCTICQKIFRLEAALQHHYQAKHNMDMPSTAPPNSSATGAVNGASAVTSSSTTATEEIAMSSTHSSPGGSGGGSTAAQYTRQQEGLLPEAPQYHLDVAPNAPEDGDIAAHWRCVNTCVLLGAVQEIETGYVFEDHVLQFTIATEFKAPSPGDPDMDFHVVRVYGGEDYWRPVQAMMADGARFLVSGRLRMVPQYDTIMKKYHHFPVIQVYPGTGSVVRV